jgi:hypothetical protein
MRISLLTSAVLVTTVGLTTTGAGEPAGWMLTRTLAAPEAVQAAAADGEFVYAISGSVVARYDRKTGKRLAVSQGTAHHLNSGFMYQGRLYCAHSNFPQKPEKSDIRVLDLKTMQLAVFRDFGQSPYGSLTWAVCEGDQWWCNFARYGADNHRTILVKYDKNWQVLETWTYPDSVVRDLGKASISGGIWHAGHLLVTGHDRQVLYRLKVPADGGVLQHLETVPAPFTGQGIAADPAGGGLIGIHRAKRQIVFAKKAEDS